MDIVIENATGLKVKYAEEPLSSVALGSGKVMKNIKTMRDTLALLMAGIKGISIKIKMYEKNNDINRRVFFIGGGMIILSSFLLSRLWKLQVTEQDKYLLLSDKNRIRITPLFPKRGIFYDRNGNELALNSTNFKLTYSNQGLAFTDQVLIEKIKRIKFR